MCYGMGCPHERWPSGTCSPRGGAFLCQTETGRVDASEEIEGQTAALDYDDEGPDPDEAYERRRDDRMNQ